MRDIEGFKQGDGTVSKPLTWSKFHIKDAVAFLGVFPQKKAVNNPDKHTDTHDPEALTLVHNLGKPNEVSIKLSPNGDINIKSTKAVNIDCETANVTASESVTIETPELTVNADQTTWNGDITQNGKLVVSDDVEIAGISFNTHKHDVVGVQSGGTTKVSGDPHS
jgi:phage baseplate assembly protein gpV